MRLLKNQTLSAAARKHVPLTRLAMPVPDR